MGHTRAPGTELTGWLSGPCWPFDHCHFDFTHARASIFFFFLLFFILLFFRALFSAVEFGAYFDYVRSLRFDEQPDYAHLRRILRGLFDRRGFSDDALFDWTLGHPPVL